MNRKHAARTLRLDFEIDLFRAALTHDPQNPTLLDALGHALTARGAYAEGLDIDRRLVALQPANATAHYNLACSYARLGRPDEAFAALRTAVALGYRDARLLARDPDLASLRGDPRFGEIVHRVRGR